MISARNVTVTRGERHLIDDVSISLSPGTFSVIIGPNGAGKSTLMKVLCGEMTPDQGLVAYGNVDLSVFSPVQLARRRAVLPQSTVLAFPFTALEIVRMGAVAQGSRHPDEQARRALAKVGLERLRGPGLQHAVWRRAAAGAVCPRARPGAACRGERRKPCAASGRAHFQPRSRTSDFRLETAKDFVAAGGTVLAILHDLNLAAEFADQLIVMHRGTVTACGSALETINDETIARVYGVGGAVGRLPADHIAYVLPQARYR